MNNQVRQPENAAHAARSSPPTGSTEVNRELSLVIPCFNEAQNLPLLIDRIDEAFAGRKHVEVILVDNGSTDQSPDILSHRLNGHPVIRSVRVDENRGYGHGILAGLAAARGSYLGWTHADMQTDPADALRALDIIRASGGHQELYVKGRRYGRPVMDVIFTIGMSLFETVLFRRRFCDVNAQPNIFSRSLYEKKCASAPHDFSLDLFFYHAAKTEGVCIKRFPVRFAERAFGKSHWNLDWRAKKKFIQRTIAFSLELRYRLR